MAYFLLVIENEISFWYINTELEGKLRYVIICLTTIHPIVLRRIRGINCNWKQKASSIYSYILYSLMIYEYGNTKAKVQVEKMRGPIFFDRSCKNVKLFYEVVYLKVLLLFYIR